MIALALVYATIFADPVTVVQFRYPTHRLTVITSSGINVSYTPVASAPPELKRAYKLLEMAEREVAISEALQLLRSEMVSNERRLEALRAARMMDYLTYRLPNLWSTFDPALIAPPESGLKFFTSQVVASDARIERALVALDRLADAQESLHQTLTAIAYPDRPRPLPRGRFGTVPAVPPDGTVPRAVVPSDLADAEKAEKTAAEVETAAEERERIARQEEIAAEARYRDSLPADRASARAEWVKAREQWEQARREWDTAREQWKAARERLNTARGSVRSAAVPVVRPAPKPGAGVAIKTAPSRRLPLAIVRRPHE